MDATGLLGTARDGLQRIGYRAELLREQYPFADMASSCVHRIDLAAFAQEPTSYRNACLGIAIPAARGPAAIRAYRALGAPQVLALYPQAGQILRWRISGRRDPEQIGAALSLDRLRDVILEHRSEWNPGEVLRAKSVAFAQLPAQLDFFDVGLVPTLEEVVQRKLDQLLKGAVASASDAYSARHGREPNYAALFRLVFRLLAAKLLADRGHPGEWGHENVQTVLRQIDAFYFRNMPPEPVLDDLHVQQHAWERIRSAFHFQNLSVEALAYAYENTLVSSQARRAHGVHATPPEIAEYVVRQLPFEELPEDHRRVFEPFAGHAPFLIAALGRLRSLLPPDLTASARHDYFVRMLTGLELDSFAREVARDSLILADYPNPDSWRVVGGDAFTSPVFDSFLQQARVVLCNPPFEDFTPEERATNPEIGCVSKAAEALRRILVHPPSMLGCVLPRAFVDGRDYAATRDRIDALYDTVSLTVLPDMAFRFSKVETVVLLAHGERTDRPRRSSALVAREDYPRFGSTGDPTWRREWPAAGAHQGVGHALWRTPLDGVWEALAHSTHLGDVAEIHRGIEYKMPLEENEADEPRPGFAPGLARVIEGFEPFVVSASHYLNISPDAMLYEAYKRPWQDAKVILNAARLSRRGWSLTGAVDDQGLVCYQRFHGCWPTAGLPIEVLAAVVNGPVANAFVREFRTGRDNQKRLLERIPVPRFDPEQLREIVSLVQEYRRCRTQWLSEPERAEYFSARCRSLLCRIDAEVLTAYSLPARVEKQLLDSFAGFERPGPVPFDRYYPPGFVPAIPWRVYTSDQFRESTARRTLERLPVLHDPDVSLVVGMLTGEEGASDD